jgi:O-antigen/teichoic acid export membrane protein
MPRPDMKKSKALLQVIFEQAIFTLSFFCTQALLARYLSVELFASFSAIYSAVILLNIVHGCVVMEPLLVFAKSAYAIKPRLLLKLHLPIALLSVLVVIYLALRIPDAPPYFIYALILALAGFVAYWTVRAIAILENKSLKSVIPALAQLAGVVAAIALIPKDSPYQLSELLAAIGLSLLVSSLLLAIFSEKKAEDPILLPTEKKSWLRFGLNNSLSQIMVWAMTHGLVIYYMSRQQAELAANFRVVMTLVLPAQYLNIAISNYGLPRLARLADEKSARFSAMARALIAATLASSLLYSLLLWLSGGLLVGLLFGDKYSGLDMRDYFLLPMILAAIQGTRTVLKALKLTHYSSWAVAGGFLCFVLVFLTRPATSVSTVFVPTVFGLGLAAVIMFYQIRKKLKDSPSRIPL